MIRRFPRGRANWLIPFACFALASLALLRPAPPTQKPAHDARIVVDADGLEVPIEIPFRGVAFTWCGGGAGGYLGVTHSPRTIVNAGSARDRESFRRTLLGWIFPDVVARDSLWDGKVYDAHGGLKSHYAELESLMAYNGRLSRSLRRLRPCARLAPRRASRARHHEPGAELGRKSVHGGAD